MTAVIAIDRYRCAKKLRPRSWPTVHGNGAGP